MFPVQPIARHRGDKELRSIGICSGIGHREQSDFGVLQFEVFIVELLSVNRFAAGPIVIRKVSALTHKRRDDAVENAILIM